MFLHPNQIPTRTIRAPFLILTRRTLLLRPSPCPTGPQHRATSASINHSPAWFRPQDSRHFSTTAKMPPLETRENTGTQRRIVIVGGVAGKLSEFTRPDSTAGRVGVREEVACLARDEKD